MTLKSIDCDSYDSAFARMQSVLYKLCLEHEYLETSTRVAERDKQKFKKLADGQSLEEVEVVDALEALIRMMAAHHGRPCVVLIDEYDVPLSKANDAGYYSEMLNLIRGMLNGALKTNPYLEFAILTGCLRIAKESIFTGVNNFVSNSIADVNYKDSFGFTEDEVMLTSANFTPKKSRLVNIAQNEIFNINLLPCSPS